MNLEHLAKEAERLKNDSVFNEALDAIRAEALDDLAKEDASDIVAVLRHQQKVAVVDEIRMMLDRYIIGAEMQDEPSPYV